jgi:hypothetical protein
METILLYAGVAVMAGFLAYQIWSQNTKKTSGELGDMPTLGRKSPLTEVQQALFRQLREALPGHIILPQIAASRVLNVDSTPGNAKRWNDMLKDETLDMLICRDDFSIVAAIKLDDPADFVPEHQQTDESVGKALSAVGIKLVRIPSNNLPPVNTLRHTFH